MAIQLTDIEDDDDISPEPVRSRIGCIVMDESGGWIAVCPALGYRSEGRGPFDDLPREAIWLVNRGFDPVKTLQDANPSVRLKLSGWMRIKIDDMPREWGVQGVSSAAEAETVASIFDRVMGVSLEAARNSGLSSQRSDADLQGTIEQSASLATGMRKIFNKGMEATVPGDTKVRKRIIEALNYGVSRVQEKKVQDGEFEFHCRIPRLTHAIRVTGQDVPSAGKWQKASIQDGDRLDDKIAELRELGLPVMVVANVKERSAGSHDYLDAWVRPNTKAIRRIAYTLEEAVELLSLNAFEDFSLIVGPGWKKSSTGKMISSLVNAAGGREVASTIWSVNAAAENILCGGFRKLGGSENLPPECVWLAARDRIEMIRPIEALLECGATLVSAYAGGIVVKVPSDPELVAMAANAAWEAGLHIPIGTIRDMQAMGVEAPYDPHSFGGAPEDIILGQLSHRAQRNAMWRFDEVLESCAADRPAAFADILG